MRIFRILYQDNSGLKCEDYKGHGIQFKDKWLIVQGESLTGDDEISVYKIVIAIPTDMIYSVEEIE